MIYVNHFFRWRYVIRVDYILRTRNDSKWGETIQIAIPKVGLFFYNGIKT